MENITLELTIGSSNLINDKSVSIGTPGGVYMNKIPIKAFIQTP
jgi:hypothetical protein